MSKLSIRPTGELAKVRERLASLSETTSVALHQRAVILLIDCSGSMGGGGKMDQAKTGAIGFARAAIEQRYEVGLLRFDSRATLLLDPQGRLEALATAAGQLSPAGSTNMGDAIRTASNSFDKRHRERVLCLVTDGMPDSRDDALAAAAEVKRAGGEIMAIGTDDADHAFLDYLVTRKELSRKVAVPQFDQAITDMARLLPRQQG
jgi:Mg-chelatase subunit ChlD